MSKARQLADLGNQVDDGAVTGSNMMINGACAVSQRGSSYQFSNTNASVYGAADRWQGRSSQGTTITQSLQSDAPAGFSKSLRYYCDSGGTITQMIRHQQKLEGQDWQHLAYGTSDAKTVTLSFWVKSNVTATYTVSLYVYDANEIYTVTYTIDSANTWEYKTVTFAGNTSGNCNNDNTHGIELAWALGASSSYKGSGVNDAWQSYESTKYATNITADIGATTGNYWQITGVCLNVGDSAIAFPHESYGDTLARCQRYYHRIQRSGQSPIVASGTRYSAAECYFAFPLPVRMRAVPSLSYSSMPRVYYAGGSDQATANFLIDNNASGEQALRLRADTPSRTAGQATWMQVYNAGDHISFDAEL